MEIQKKKVRILKVLLMIQNLDVRNVVKYFALVIHSFLGEVKMYSKEELVLKIIFRGSSVIFKNYDYPAVMLSFVQIIVL